MPPDQPSAGAPAPTTPGATDLVISGTDGAGGTIRWHLTCDPPGGDHPDPEGACRALEDHGAQALPPVAKDRVCTQVYGGPEVATVQGTWHGRPVLTTFSRTDGCQIGRWNALAALLPPVGT